jgi:hypothetical protein
MVMRFKGGMENKASKGKKEDLRIRVRPTPPSWHYLTKDKATSMNDYGRLQTSFVPSHLLLASNDDRAIQEQKLVEY